jgi:hypothetical protein
MPQRRIDLDLSDLTGLCHNAGDLILYWLKRLPNLGDRRVAGSDVLGEVRRCRRVACCPRNCDALRSGGAARLSLQGRTVVILGICTLRGACPASGAMSGSRNIEVLRPAARSS